jgi:hypothetical protein
MRGKRENTLIKELDFIPSCIYKHASVLAYRNTVQIRGGPAAVIGEALHNSWSLPGFTPLGRQ